VFAVNGAVLGTWAAQIPWVQERFGLSNGALGLVLVGMGLAVIVAFPIAGQAIARHGSVRIVWVGGVACVLALNLPVLAPHPLLVAFGLTLLGAASATQDVAMNTHGVGVETDFGRPIMSSLHAGWAFGGILGASFAAACAALGLDPRVSVSLASALLLGLLVASARRIGEGSAGSGADTPGFTLPSRGVVLLAVLCFLVMLTEGAMMDWGGVYLRDGLGAAQAVAALAFAFFAAGLTLGRVLGDWVNHRIGAVALLRLGAFLTGIPLATLLVVGEPIVALCGLFLVGLGLSNGVPLMFSAAGRQPGTSPGPGIAAVSSMGSLGLLAGPPVIGLLADAISLPAALATLVGAAVVVLGLAGRAAGRAEATPDSAAVAPVALP
jgi:predicted MFS family arabinose efflux permease